MRNSFNFINRILNSFSKSLAGPPGQKAPGTKISFPRCLLNGGVKTRVGFAERKVDMEDL